MSQRKKTKGADRKAAPKAKTTPVVSAGGLTDAEFQLLLGVMPLECWQLIHGVFTNKSTIFSANVVKPAVEVQEFTRALIKHSGLANPTP